MTLEDIETDEQRLVMETLKVLGQKIDSLADVVGILAGNIASQQDQIEEMRQQWTAYLKRQG